MAFEKRTVVPNEDNGIYIFKVAGATEPAAAYVARNSDQFEAYYDFDLNLSGSDLWDITGPCTYEQFMEDVKILTNKEEQYDSPWVVNEYTVDTVYSTPEGAHGLSVAEIKEQAVAEFLEMFAAQLDNDPESKAMKKFQELVEEFGEPRL